MKTPEEIIKEAHKLKYNYKYSDEWLLDIVRITKEECKKEAQEIFESQHPSPVSDDGIKLEPYVDSKNTNTFDLQRPSPVSDEEIDAIIDEFMDIVNEEVNVTHLGNNKYKVDWYMDKAKTYLIDKMRSRLQQPVGIEWPDENEIKTISQKWFKESTDPEHDIISFNEGLRVMLAELKSRVKVADSLELLEFVRTSFQNSPLEFDNYWEDVRAFPNRTGKDYTSKELIELYNQRTGEGRKG